jgi:hypothetical protein
VRIRRLSQKSPLLAQRMREKWGRRLPTFVLVEAKSRFLHYAVPFDFAQGPVPVGMTRLGVCGQSGATIPRLFGKEVGEGGYFAEVDAEGAA